MRKMGSVDMVPKKKRALYVVLVAWFLSRWKCKLEVHIFMKEILLQDWELKRWTETMKWTQVGQKK